MTIRDEPRNGKVPQAVRSFADSWQEYRKAGHRDTIPVDGKVPPRGVVGFTGWTGRDPALAELRAWARKYGHLNIALRCPEGVAGIDVDAYKGKSGAATLAHLLRWLGPLPPTYISTARRPADPISGIRWYRVPPGTVLAGQAGPGIEIIQRHHRYAVVWPSIHPETGSRYRWYLDRDDRPLNFIPGPDSLPDLPAGWLEALESARSEARPAETASLQAARKWYVERAYGEPCDYMAALAEKAAIELREAAELGGLHDTACVATLRLFRAAAEGHPGLDECLAPLKPIFLSADRPRSRGLADEWRSVLRYSGKKVAPDDAGDPDPCTDEDLSDLSPFGGAR